MSFAVSFSVLGAFLLFVSHRPLSLGSVAANCVRLLRDEPPLRPMSSEELEFHALAAGVEVA